jgi:hypothetical protein
MSGECVICHRPGIMHFNGEWGCAEHLDAVFLVALEEFEISDAERAAVEVPE